MHSEKSPRPALHRDAPTKIFRACLAELRKLRGPLAMEGLFLGALIGVCGLLLGFNALIHADIGDDFLIIPMLTGITLAHTRARSWLRLAALLVVGMVFVVGYTPIVNRLVIPLQHSDSLHRVPAIVVLSSYIYRDGSLNDAGQERILEAYRLLRKGYSARLVVTEAASDFGSQLPFIRGQMNDLGLDYTVEVTGSVHDTHDEAREVARLVHKHNWSEVILVTHPWHMLRARSVFQKAGVHVLCAPCHEGNYDIHDLSSPGNRLHAFRDWLHEIIGYSTYRLRGWI